MYHNTDNTKNFQMLLTRQRKTKSVIEPTHGSGTRIRRWPAVRSVVGAIRTSVRVVRDGNGEVEQAVPVTVNTRHGNGCKIDGKGVCV